MPVEASKYLELVRDPGTQLLSPTKLASVFELPQHELARLAGVHRNTMRLHPELPRVQATLIDLMHLLSAALALQPDLQRAVFFIKNGPIAAFGYKSLMRLVAEGRAGDAVAYVESLASGFVG